MQTTALKRHTNTVAANLIQALREGRAPWQRTWSPGQLPWPRNGVTGRQYSGSNLLMLLLAPFADARWAGFGQIRDAGGHVRGGEHGRMILIAKPRTPRADAADGDEEDLRPRFFLRSAHVFNFEQTEGLPDADEIAVAPDETATGIKLDRILKRAGVRIEHKPWAEPSYNPRTDVVMMPEPRRFDDLDEYRQTLIHEVAHATGHPSRMDRWTDGKAETRRTEPGYRLEELRAEITAMILGHALNLGNDPSLRNSEAYVGHWIEGLENHPETIRTVAGDAQAICEWLTRGIEDDALPAGVEAPAA